MPIINDHLTIFRPDGTSQAFPTDEAIFRVRMSPGEWSRTPPPPLNWEREIPRYRASRDLLPAQKARFRSEPPFAETWQSDVWQYADREYAAGEEIESKCWPHPSLRPLTYSAERVLTFFKSEMKSRLPVSPWFAGRVRLDTGLNNAPGIVDVSPPKLQPANLRPVA